MISIKEKYAHVGNSLTILHGTFYHVKPYGSNEQGALYQGLENKLHIKAPDIFASNNRLFYCDTDKALSFSFDGKKTELITNKAAIYKKMGLVYLGTNLDLSMDLYDDKFQVIPNIKLENKSLIYSDLNRFIYYYKNSEYLERGRIVPNDPRHLRVMECTDFHQNVLWVYATEHLGTYQTTEKFKREYDVNTETGETIERLIILETKQNPVLFANGEKPLVIGNIMLFGTDTLWIVAIDIATGEELYVIKNIEDTHFQNPFDLPNKPLIKNQPWIGALRYHKETDVVYSFMSNTYLEIDYKTGKLLFTDNRTAEFMLMHKTSQSRLSEHAYWRINDIIYYISDMELEGDKTKTSAFLTAYNIKTREMVFEYPLGNSWKDKCALHAFKKFQLVGNLFYILDYNNTLWVFEDDEFYTRHPDLKIK